MDEETIERDG
jgi:hypothetical protein